MPTRAARLILVVLVLGVSLLVGNLQAYRPSTAPRVLVSASKPPVPLLWKVSDPNNAVYLLGSFHLLKPDDYPLADDVNRAFADSANLVFEIPPDEMTSSQLGLQMAQAARLGNDATLNPQLSATTRARLAIWTRTNKNRLQTLGPTAARLQMFKPWYVGMLVSLVEMDKSGLDGKLGLDQHFMDAAKAAGKTTSGFETGAQQIALLDGMTAQEQIQYLDEALTDAAAGGQQIAAMHAAWRAGNEAELWSNMAADMQRAYPALYQHINIERNNAWVPKIEQLLSEPGARNSLVVVGTLHLLGSDGVVDKLRAKGYAVERICTGCAVNAKAPSDTSVPPV